jgi:hypothetical protein
MKVLFLPEVREYFRELAGILYQKGYFGLEEAAIEYARGLFNDISSKLPNKIKKPAPAHFNRYGENMYYAVFKKNQRTRWYVFFNIYTNIYTKNGETIYLVRYMNNNHVTAQHL